MSDILWPHYVLEGILVTGTWIGDHVDPVHGDRRHIVLEVLHLADVPSLARQQELVPEGHIRRGDHTSSLQPRHGERGAGQTFLRTVVLLLEEFGLPPDFVILEKR